MKKLLFVFFSVTILSSCVNDDKEYIKNSDYFKNLNPEEFKSSFEQNGGIILDVRTNDELKSGIIEDASTIDFYDGDFKKKIAKIQKEKIVYVYCKSGGRSSQAAQLLVESGQSNVINLKGGIMAWKKAGYSLFSLDNTADANIQAFTKTEFENILSQNNLVLVDFHTLWCVPCRKMAPIIDELEQKYLDKIYISRVDIDKSEDLANQFEITVVPTLVLFKGAKGIWRKTGVISKEELIKILDNNISFTSMMMEQ